MTRARRIFRWSLRDVLIEYKLLLTREAGEAFDRARLEYYVVVSNGGKMQKPERPRILKDLDAS